MLGVGDGKQLWMVKNERVAAAIARLGNYGGYFVEKFGEDRK